MIIGIDATCWANGRGYGRFARELIRAMSRSSPDDQFVCFGDRRAFDAYSDPSPNVRPHEVRLDESPTVAASAESSRSLRDLLRLTRAVAATKLDVFLSPSVYTYFPLPPGLPAVVTIHDTIPEQFPALTLPSPRARLFWSLKVRFALMQARLVLTVSDYSADSIVRHLGVSRDRIRVCTEAPGAAYRPSSEEEIRAAARRIGLADDATWFVYVGGFNPHKRVDLILKAHAAIASTTTPAPRLLLVGTRTEDVFHGEGGRLDAIIAEAGTKDLIHWTGFLPDEQLVPVLGGATALLLPSESEGFGLPAVEAAACGTPVVATLESPLPDLLPGGGIFVKPGDLPALSDAMRRLLDANVRRGTSQRALEGARKLSWDRAAEAAHAALVEAAMS